MCSLQELQKQARLAVPLGANLLANYSTSIISLTFLAPLGNEYIAAASLAESTYWMFGKLLVQSLCGALDTRASQVQPDESYSYSIGGAFARARAAEAMDMPGAAVSAVPFWLLLVVAMSGTVDSMSAATFCMLNLPLLIFMHMVWQGLMCWQTMHMLGSQVWDFHCQSWLLKLPFPSCRRHTAWEPSTRSL